MPAIAGRAGVPPRRPISWPPPAISGARFWSGRRISAPAPMGPPALWPEMAMETAPSASQSCRARAAACAASTCRAAPCRAQSAAAVARSCRTPVSLFAAIRQTSAPGWAASRCSNAPASISPSGMTGTVVARGAAARTASCSVAPISTGRPRPSAVTAKALASVAPEVKTMSAGRAWKAAARASRASSRMRRAARPARCTEAGLAACIAAQAASRAAGRNGSVALASR